LEDIGAPKPNLIKKKRQKEKEANDERLLRSSR
jgi:hypothetical protein